jgi:hypothetical protein
MRIVGIDFTTYSYPRSREATPIGEDEIEIVCRSTHAVSNTNITPGSVHVIKVALNRDCATEPCHHVVANPLSVVERNFGTSRATIALIFFWSTGRRFFSLFPFSFCELARVQDLDNLTNDLN